MINAIKRMNNFGKQKQPMKAQKLVQIKSSYMTFPSELLSQIIGNPFDIKSHRPELFSQFKRLFNSQNPPCPLNANERKILNLLRQGLSNHQAFERAGLRKSSYFLNILYRKLNARNKSEAIYIVENEGWLDAPEIRPSHVLKAPKKSLTANEHQEMRRQGYSFRYEFKDGILTKCALMTLKKWTILKDDWERQKFNFLRGNNSADRWAHIEGTNYPVITITES
jgi:DNA-binding CsgD family transcriptional regulator